ncbi:MAG: hypothetical protein RL701_5481 [Pseudomonadota bacterium]|jgi:hypothetical protein
MQPLAAEIVYVHVYVNVNGKSERAFWWVVLAVCVLKKKAASGETPPPAAPSLGG